MRSRGIRVQSSSNADGALEGAVVVWFRLDLRLADNPALAAATARGGTIVPVFVWAPDEDGGWPPGAASRWWLHHSLRGLDENLRARGSRLILRNGPSLQTLRELIRETGAMAVYWNRRYEPAARERDAAVEGALRQAGIEVRTFNSALLVEPGDLATRAGRPFQVFILFWKAAATLEPHAPVDAPSRLSAPRRWSPGVRLDQLALLPEVDWAAGLRAAWTPGESGAHAQVRMFFDEAAGYTEARDRPGVRGTSRVSPHLHFGEISPHAVYHALQEQAAAKTWSGVVRGTEAFLRQLYWREFAHHLLFHFPHTTDAPLNPAFREFPWRSDAKAFWLWSKGKTGYPIVDAAMRELWTIGWMHNRARMIAASFLVKDLLLPWQQGARGFWDTLVDADLANNTLGWQWVAGCGADAAPYFRVFNPELQSRKFDSDGAYICAWAPELARLPDARLHAPWTAAPAELHAAGIILGRDYPRRMVDHSEARADALAAYEVMKSQRRSKR